MFDHDQGMDLPFFDLTKSFLLVFENGLGVWKIGFESILAEEPPTRCGGLHPRIRIDVW
jgi:hypothetical protein